VKKKSQINLDYKERERGRRTSAREIYKLNLNDKVGPTTDRFGKQTENSNPANLLELRRRDRNAGGTSDLRGRKQGNMGEEGLSFLIKKTREAPHCT